LVVTRTRLPRRGAFLSSSRLYELKPGEVLDLCGVRTLPARQSACRVGEPRLGAKGIWLQHSPYCSKRFARLLSASHAPFGGHGLVSYRDLRRSRPSRPPLRFLVACLSSHLGISSGSATTCLARWHDGSVRRLMAQVGGVRGVQRITPLLLIQKAREPQLASCSLSCCFSKMICRSSARSMTASQITFGV
jgi:hypothetical protein